MKELLIVLVVIAGLITLVCEWLLASWVADSLLHLNGFWNIAVKIILMLFLGNLVKVFTQEAITAWSPKK